MPFRPSSPEGSGRLPREIWVDWMDANEAGDVERAGSCALEMTEAAPASFSSWFEAGLYAKARRDWGRCLAWNARALELSGEAEAEEFGGSNPAAWNLGIAATALGDWATARRAWTAYGIRGLGDEAGPIDDDFGMAPIRLNPDRPSLALEVTPAYGDTEIIWCWRRSPAHGAVASVPLPESGHRFRDVLLHDGEPKGSRRDGDREVSVFDEIARLSESDFPTWQAQVAGASPEDVEAVGDFFGERGLGADNWSGINIMCSDCSHGSPSDDHHHEKPSDGTVILGLAGHEDDVAQCLESWQAARPEVSVLALELLW
jgi:PAS domain-containing protein